MSDADYLIPAGAGIGHVHLRVSDIDRALAFYCGVLGFKLVARFKDSAAFVASGDYHHHIGLNTWESRGASPPPPRHTGLYHVAIRYPSRRDLAVAVRRVIRSGVPLHGSSDHGVSISIYTEDPNGNTIEWSCSVRPITAQHRREAPGRLVGDLPLDAPTDMEFFGVAEHA